MLTHRLEARRTWLRARDGIGGRPLLAAGQAWPRCRCGEAMTFYFQLDLRAKYLVPFLPMSHLLVFQCWNHAEAAFPPPYRTAQLRDDYWIPPENEGGECWRLLLNRPGAEAWAAEVERKLVPMRLVAAAVEEAASRRTRFKVGGTPDWAQHEERYRCSCGAPMAFVCQVPLNHHFAQADDTPDADDAGMIFLGNEVYITACTAQCRPEAVWPVNQN